VLLEDGRQRWRIEDAIRPAFWLFQARAPDPANGHGRFPHPGPTARGGRGTVWRLGVLVSDAGSVERFVRLSWPFSRRVREVRSGRPKREVTSGNAH